VKSFLATQLVPDNAFLDFLSRFVYDQKIHSMGDKTYRVTVRFNYKALKDFVELEACKTRLEALMANPLWNQMDDKIQEMGRLFMLNYHNRDKESISIND
ncbi:MAG: hypothetical protein K2W88_09910, partial [Pararheinheimera sp.]|nr:hypothetical protein [Rheinheimera sp.]